jgi:phosphoribosylformylglycinamidine cyclo-ligase
MKPTTYSDSGVNIDAADQTVDMIKQLAKKTFSSQVVTGIGSFGAGYRLDKNVLVSSADGVGTKVKIAIETQCHNTVGHDLVNHCVNDIGVQGAEPLFFLDYFATGKLIPAVTAQVIQGIAAGCTENHCSLIGGETAEMPGMYQPNDYDLAGFIVGVVSEDLMITGSGIQAGDTLIALPSNGLHTNGYSLARQVLRQHYDWDSHVPELGATLAAELLRIHQSYLPTLQLLLGPKLLGAAHITGGGITENLPRILKKSHQAVIDTATWEVPTIFQLIQQLGQVPVGDWRRTFNLGVGMILAVPGNGAYASGVLKQAGVEHWIVGTVQERPSADADQVLWV